MKQHLLKKEEKIFPFENVIQRTGFFIMEKTSFNELQQDVKFHDKWKRSGLKFRETILGKLKITYEC